MHSVSSDRRASDGMSGVVPHVRGTHRTRQGDGFASEVVTPKTRLSTNARMVVLYAKLMRECSRTARRIWWLDTQASETWKHMPMVKAKYAKSKYVGGRSPGKSTPPTPSRSSR